MKRQFCEAQLQALLCQAETISSREAWLRMEGLLPASWQPCLKEAPMATLNNRITRQKALKWIQKGLNSVEEDDMDYAEAHKDLVACTHLNMQDTATDMAKWLEILSQQMMTEDKCFVAICLGSFLPGVATAAWEKTLKVLQHCSCVVLWQETTWSKLKVYLQNGRAMMFPHMVSPICWRFHSRLKQGSSRLSRQVTISC
jgi:hypothetical protein